MGTSPNSGRGAEILWDQYGVPHIFAQDAADLFHAMGWTQMRNHGNLLLRLYGQARGRAAEYWGQQYLQSDLWVATMGIPQRAREWLDAQSPLFRGYLEAFVAGINDHARAHPDQISADASAVLSVEAVDVLAHSLRVVNFSFVVDLESIASLVQQSERRLGSNGWAIGPTRSASGHAMLLTNPHMPWGDRFLCFEAHLAAPGIHAYGMTLVGFPVLTMAFNNTLGWCHTFNRYQGWTLYQLELAEGGYRLDGTIRGFEAEEKVVQVRQPDGFLRAVTTVVRRSVHGPIFETDGKAFGLRVVGLDHPRALEQWWQMACAMSLVEFETALQCLQIPMFTVLYADRDGNIMHLFNGQVPIRSEGDSDYWAGIVPGNVSTNIWKDTHSYGDLPRVLNPSSGWLHNANDPPWTTTFPPALHPDHYPSYMAPRGPMSLRAQRSALTLMEQGRLSLEEMVRQKYSTVVELADRVLDDLISAARLVAAPRVRAAVKVLCEWDRRADADSRGAVLFVLWAQAMDPDRFFAVPWNELLPLTTPHGLADPAGAVATLEEVAIQVDTLFGSLDVKWGDVFRLHSTRTSLPASGADKSGVLTELWFVSTSDNRFAAVGGDCYIAAVEFSNPVRAMVLTVYGNATQPASELGDEQLMLFSRKQLRPALLERTQILEHLAHREFLDRGPHSS